jgi:AsmA protein
MKKILVIVAVVVVVLLLVVIALPFFINVNQFKPTLETDLSQALGRKVDIGNIDLAILSGGVSIDDVSISDDPAFSATPFLKTKKLTVGVAILPLIFSRKLEVRSFTISDPEVSLMRSSSGIWNFSSLGAASAKTGSKGVMPAAAPAAPKSTMPADAAKSKGDDPPAATNFTVEKLTISNGTITVSKAGEGRKASVYSALNLEAFDLSYTTQFPFQLTANTPGGGTVNLVGKAGPVSQSDAAETPLNATVVVQHLDIASTGFVDPSSGLAGSIDFNGDIASDGHQASTKGTVKADKLKLVPAGSPATVSVNVDYETDYDLKTEAGVLKRGDVHIGKALAHLTGTFATTGNETSVHMKLNGQGMSVPDLEGVLPAVGVALPSGASLTTGTLDANLAINGPVNKLNITGPINLQNGKLAGFSLKSKLGALGPLAGLAGGGGSSDTEIQTLSADLKVDPQATHADNLSLVVPSIGTITGTANVSASGQLDCKMSAKLAAGNPVGALTSGIGALTGGGKSSGGGIPFKIQGTTSNPVFYPDVAGALGGLAKSGASGASDLGSQAHGVIGGLFGKKKK